MSLFRRIKTKNSCLVLKKCAFSSVLKNEQSANRQRLAKIYSVLCFYFRLKL